MRRVLKHINILKTPVRRAAAAQSRNRIKYSLSFITKKKKNHFDPIRTRRRAAWTAYGERTRLSVRPPRPSRAMISRERALGCGVEIKFSKCQLTSSFEMRASLAPPSNKKIK